MKETNQQFKQSFSGSVGSGVGAIFNASGKRFYILEHKVTSQYHKAGESQRIIIDEITIGRNPECQVRFDESFKTVSRLHAAIRKEGENYVLIQLSKTNTTYLNGVPVQDRWYLQNGDEIQLSTNGPKLGFIIPQGDQSLVKSIGLTARLSLFRQQALAPYKKALTALSIFLVLAIAGGVTLGVIQGGKIKDQGEVIEAQDVTIKKMSGELEKFNKNNAQLAKELARMDSINKAQDAALKRRASGGGGMAVPANRTAAIAGVKGSVCYIVTTVYADGEKISRSSGTGFLLSDGTLVTARHVVEPWWFDLSDDGQLLNIALTAGVIDVRAEIVAYHGDQRISLSNKSFRTDKSQDIVVDGLTLVFPAGGYGTKRMMSTDWACASTSHKGTIVADFAASTTLQQGEPLYVLGFPKGHGFADGEKLVEPIYNEMSASRTGLADDGCIMASNTVDHGNSGGPIFANRNGKLVAVGIVSRLDNKSDQYAHHVPIKNINR